jgi:hypothetical protein
LKDVKEKSQDHFRKKKKKTGFEIRSSSNKNKQKAKMNEKIIATMEDAKQVLKFLKFN